MDLIDQLAEQRAQRLHLVADGVELGVDAPFEALHGRGRGGHERGVRSVVGAGVGAADVTAEIAEGPAQRLHVGRH